VPFIAGWATEPSIAGTCGNNSGS